LVRSLAKTGQHLFIPAIWHLFIKESLFRGGGARDGSDVPAMHPDISGRLLLGYRWHNAEYYTVRIGGNGFAYTLVHYQPGTGWRFPLAFAGSPDRELQQGPRGPIDQARRLKV
jgi:hypothetical protein